MKWEKILKAPPPMVDMPEPDRYFEYGPEWIEKTLKEWDKNNPAKVIHIEAPSRPDPSVRLDDESIRFAPSGSKKYLTHGFRFITDRPIDDEKGLFKKFKDAGYKIFKRLYPFIKANYGEKINRIVVPEEAVLYQLRPTKKVAEAQRRKYPKRDRIVPDRSRTIESIEQWNKEKNKYNLGSLEGFKDRISQMLNNMFPPNSDMRWPFDSDITDAHRKEAYRRNKPDNVPFGIIKEYFKITAGDVRKKTDELLSGAFGRNKHDLYLSQQLPLNRTWILQNITRPAFNELSKAVDAVVDSRVKALKNQPKPKPAPKPKSAPKPKRKQRPPVRGQSPRSSGKIGPSEPKRRQKKLYRKIEPMRGKRGGKSQEDTERMDVSKSWQNILKRRLSGKKFRNHVANTIDNMSEWEVLDNLSQQEAGGKNGRIDFTEEPDEPPEGEPRHKLFPPNTPKNMNNYMRRLPAKLRQTARGKGGGRTGQFKL